MWKCVFIVVIMTSALSLPPSRAQDTLDITIRKKNSYLVKGGEILSDLIQIRGTQFTTPIAFVPSISVDTLLISISGRSASIPVDDHSKYEITYERIKCPKKDARIQNWLYCWLKSAISPKYSLTYYRLNRQTGAWTSRIYSLSK